MAQVITDRRDIDFVLYEQFNVEELTQHEKFAEFNKKTFDLIINEARNLAVKEILPTFAEGDREGVRLENRQVKVPACYHRSSQIGKTGRGPGPESQAQEGGQKQGCRFL
jgi:hypothetical protein